jgi:hypothetical protein
MKLKNQILLVNICFLAGLAFEYFQGTPVLVILIAGILCLLTANIIFFIRVRNAGRRR